MQRKITKKNKEQLQELVNVFFQTKAGRQHLYEVFSYVLLAGARIRYGDKDSENSKLQLQQDLAKVLDILKVKLTNL